MRSLFYNASRAEKERRKRINVALWAYAYEIMDEPMVSDFTFDTLCHKIDLSIATNRPDLDEWFCRNFNPDTGQWIHKHPELKRIGELYDKLRS